MLVTPRTLRNAVISQHIRTLCVAAPPPRAGVSVLSYPAAPGCSDASHLSRLACSRRAASLRLGLVLGGCAALRSPSLRSIRAARDGSDAYARAAVMMDME